MTDRILRNPVVFYVLCFYYWCLKFAEEYRQLSNETPKRTVMYKIDQASSNTSDFFVKVVNQVKMDTWKKQEWN